VWDEFDQGIIDSSVKQWHRHLYACVAANGGQFEHKLSETSLELFKVHLLQLCLILVDFSLSYRKYNCGPNFRDHGVYKKKNLNIVRE